MTSVDDVTGHIDNTAPVLDASLGNARAAFTDAEQVAAGLTAAKNETEKLAEAFANLGATGKAALATQAAGQAEELTTSAQTAKTNIDSTVGHLGKLKDDLRQHRGRVEALRPTKTSTPTTAPAKVWLDNSTTTPSNGSSIWYAKPPNASTPGKPASTLWAASKP